MKTTQQPHPIAHGKEEMRTVRDFAKRAQRHDARFDDATLQLLREWLWRQLSAGEFDLETARTLLPLIIAARRINLTERKFAEHENEWTVEEHTEAVREMFGTFPPPVPFNAPSLAPTNQP